MKKTSQTNGTLYIVSTSIGNKKDITIRATEVLQNCDFVVGEEMKEASRVLMHLNLSKPIELLNEHNEQEKVEELINLIESGKSIALISDCGTPIFADPGIELLRAAIQKQIDIQVIPGASSIMTAIVRSGFDLKRFFYAGFLNRNSKERIREIQDLSNFPYTIVVMDTPYRLKVLLQDFSEVMPYRKAYLGLNLTMQSETHHYGTFLELFEKFKSIRTRNEYVLVIEGNQIGDLNTVLDTFEIEDKLKTNIILPKDDKRPHPDDESKIATDDKDPDTNAELDNELLDNNDAEEKLELIEGDEDLTLDDESGLKVIVEQKQTKVNRNRSDNKRPEASIHNKFGRGKRRDDHRQANKRGGDRRSGSRPENLRDRYTKDDDRQGVRRRNDSNRGEKERRDNNFRDGYRKRNDEYRVNDRPRREKEDGGFRKSNDLRDSNRKRNEDFRRDDRRIDKDYKKDDRNKRDNFNKDNNRFSRGGFEKQQRKRDDMNTNQKKNFEQKRGRIEISDNYESRDKRDRRSFDDRSPSRKSSSRDRGSNPKRRSEKSSKSQRRQRRKIE